MEGLGFEKRSKGAGKTFLQLGHSIRPPLRVAYVVLWASYDILMRRQL
jgi:hypothetical protein